MFKGSYDKAYKGLDNSMGANNCFLNVVIQSLWHLGSFRRIFKDQQLHKHKKGKMVPKKQDTNFSSMPTMPLPDTSGGYPETKESGSTGYPVLDGMPAYPSLGSDIPSTVPTSTSKPPGEIGYPSVSGYPNISSTPAPTSFSSTPSYPAASSYPNPSDFTAVHGMPPSSASMSVPTAPSAPARTATYKEISSTAYPSMSGISATKFHEEVKAPAPKTVIDVSKKAYPKFDDNGNIDCCDENEPVASTNMPYGTKSIPKPDRELTVEESCLFCNLLTLFVNYEFDESNVLTPSHVRQALDSITGSNGIQGFDTGSMAWAQETFEEILRYLHRDYIKPNYFEKYWSNPEKLKAKEEEYEETGWSTSCVSHSVFGLDIGEFLACNNCQYLDDVQNTHLDYFLNLYTEELLAIEDSDKSTSLLDTMIKKMHEKESSERNTNPKVWECKRGILIPKSMQLFSNPSVFTFAFHWIDPDEADRNKIKRVFKMITPVINTDEFMGVAEKDSYKKTFILRGFVSYYGKHYMAYFYSEKHDYWLHFNDSKITQVGNFEDVVNAWIKGKELPILVFYESLEFLESILSSTKKEKQYYNPKQFLKEKNRFWFKGRYIHFKSFCYSQFLSYLL